MQRRNFIGTLLASPVAAWLAGKVKVGRTIHVPPGHFDFDSLGAESGDTVCFSPGTYTSNIEYGKSSKIVWKNNTIHSNSDGIHVPLT